MKRILFVDDEQRVLDGLERMLYSLRSQWQMVFANGGRRALELLSQSEIDLLVTDLRMPEVDGIELLSEVRKRYPQVIRIVMSGTAEHGAALQSVSLAHQYLVKPCDPALLRATLDRAFHLHLMFDDPALKQVISSIHALPSVPGVYLELMEALRSPETAAAEIAGIIARDMGMTAKILQLVNSAFFGIGRRIADPTEAVIYLGMEIVRDLALTASVFSRFDTRAVAGFSVEGLHQHSLAVATQARQIAKSLHPSRTDVAHAFAGGLLHDVGKLVLASNLPKRYAEAMRQVERTTIPIRDAELEIFGTTHAEVGGYLLWLWNLPEPVVEAVGFHHAPPDSLSGMPCPALAVHTANVLVNEQSEQDH